MRITSVAVRTLRLAMPGDARNARRRWTEKSILLCFVETDAGLTGVGEGWTSYASPRALTATIEDDVAPLIVGRDLDDIDDLEETCRRSCVMSGRYGITAVALSAVEIALWDLKAQAAGLPLWRYLGGAVPRVPVYASGGLYRDGAGPDALAREMTGYRDLGFTAVKIKIGGAPLNEDIARIAAVRRALGPAPALLVDAHYTMTVDGALRFADAADPYKVGWLEAPILPTDWEGHRHLAEASPIPLCGNETLPWRDGFMRLIDAGVRYIMPDVSACGGIAETLAIGRAAHAAGRTLTLHSSSSIVLFLASLHVAAAIGEGCSVESHMMHRWLFDLMPQETFAVADGAVTLGNRPGLGLSITPDALDARTAA